MNKNQTIGSTLLVLGAALGIFAYAHRPIEGFGDALTRNSTWVLKPEPYYGALFVAALFVIAGILRFVMKPKASPDAQKSNG